MPALTQALASTFLDFSSLEPAAYTIAAILVSAIGYVAYRVGKRHPRWGKRALWVVGIWFLTSAVVGAVVTLTS